jgi:hypothetical protein
VIKSSIEWCTITQCQFKVPKYKVPTRSDENCMPGTETLSSLIGKRLFDLLMNIDQIFAEQITLLASFHYIPGFQHG